MVAIKVKFTLIISSFAIALFLSSCGSDESGSSLNSGGNNKPPYPDVFSLCRANIAHGQNGECQTFLTAHYFDGVRKERQLESIAPAAGGRNACDTALVALAVDFTSTDVACAEALATDGWDFFDVISCAKGIIEVAKDVKRVSKTCGVSSPYY